MTIGGGIIAKSMRGMSTDATIFASGVSNSACTDTSEFLRERDLILAQDHRKKIVYFSTCSLSDASETNAYICHKLEMEKLISERFDNWLVLRLPTVVGSGGNPNNFFNFIASTLKRGDTLYVQSKVRRSLLDAEDIRILTQHLIEHESHQIVDVCLDNSRPVLEIVNYMRDLIGSKSEIVILDDKQNKEIDNSLLRRLNPEGFSKVNIDSYNEKLTKKYLPK